MAKLVWDATGAHLYETGIDHGVVYPIGSSGNYDTGVAWNGLTSVSEKPTGADSTALYADNIKYLNLVAAEDFEATVEAYTYPDEFAECDGSAAILPGVMVSQQNRKVFGMSYRTVVGNDTDGNSHGYKLHLIYGATVSPSEKSYSTINDSPEAITFSWDMKTTPVNVGTIDGVEYKPTACVVIDSTKVDPVKLAALEDVLYGSNSGSNVNARLPLPAEVYSLLKPGT